MAASVSVPTAAQNDAANSATLSSYEKQATELAAILRAARVVVSNHQALINNAEIGNKNFTAQLVLTEMKEIYKKNNNKDFPVAKNGILPERVYLALLGSIEQVVNHYQPVINLQGRGFKGFIPAVFTREVAKAFSTKMQGTITMKFTAPRKLVRNRDNRPDIWENSNFETKFNQPGYNKSHAYFEIVDNTFRYMAPEYYVSTCLSCHGEPKGERDISGYLREGAKLGDLGGALSISIELSKVNK